MSKVENLKVGDKAFISVNEHEKLCTVDRVTKIYIYAEGIRFHRISGLATGQNIGWIRPANETDIKRLGNSAANNKIQNNMTKKITDFELGIWHCIQILIKERDEWGARVLIQNSNFSLDFQKRLQNAEGNSFQEDVERFWEIEYKNQ